MNIFLLITYHLHFELVSEQYERDIGYIVMFSSSFNYKFTYKCLIWRCIFSNVVMFIH